MIIKKKYPLLLSYELIPMHPNKGFYIESNGMKIYQNENKELYELALKNHFDYIRKIKEEYDNNK